MADDLYTIRQAVRMSRLIWKWEDGPEDAEGDTPEDVGPAWIIEADGSERDVKGGAWITRAEAERLAAEEGHILETDE